MSHHAIKVHVASLKLHILQGRGGDFRELAFQLSKFINSGVVLAIVA